MSKNILIVNFHSTENAGDLALLQTIIKKFLEIDPTINFIISANFPEEKPLKQLNGVIVPSPWNLVGGGTNRKPRWLLFLLTVGWIIAVFRLYYLPGINRTRWADLFKAYIKADAIFAVPGNQFFSSGNYGWPIFAISMSINLARVFNRPIYILPQSIGPFRQKWEEILLKRTYSRARLIFLRDQRSMQLARKVGLPSGKVFFSPDPAFCFEAEHKDCAFAILENYGFKKEFSSIGLTVIGTMRSYLNQKIIESYYFSLAKVLEQFVDQYHCQVFFFHQVIGPSIQEDDRIATKIVMQNIRRNNQYFHVVHEIMNPQLLKSCYGWMDMFIASRLHSGIFSMSTGVPTVFIGYLHKTRGVLEAMGLSENMIEIEKINYTELFHLFERVWLTKEDQRKKLMIKIPQLTNEIEKMARLVVNDIRGING